MPFVAEVICFRLMLLLAGTSLLGFGASAAYEARQRNALQVLGIKSGELWAKIAIDCEDRREAECELASIVKRETDEIRRSRDDHRQRFQLYRMLSVLVPIALIFLFYSLRLALTGQVRPLFPRATTRCLPPSA